MFRPSFFPAVRHVTQTKTRGKKGGGLIETVYQGGGAGPRGATGPKGDTGDVGPAGPTGPAGPAFLLIGRSS